MARNLVGELAWTGSSVVIRSRLSTEIIKELSVRLCVNIHTMIRTIVTS